MELHLSKTVRHVKRVEVHNLLSSEKDARGEEVMKHGRCIVHVCAGAICELDSYASLHLRSPSIYLPFHSFRFLAKTKKL